MKAIILSICTMMACWGTMNAQRQESSVFYTHFDLFRGIGYGRAPEGDQGKITFRIISKNEQPVMPVMVQGASQVSSCHFTFIPPGERAYIDDVSGRSIHRTYGYRDTLSMTYVRFEKYSRQGLSRWHLAAWEHLTPTSSWVVAPIGKVPRRYRLNRVPPADAMIFDCPDTTRMDYLATRALCDYRGDTLTWERQDWKVLRRGNRPEERMVTHQETRRVVLPRPDPWRTLGAWGLLSPYALEAILKNE